MERRGTASGLKSGRKEKWLSTTRGKKTSYRKEGNEKKKISRKQETHSPTKQKRKKDPGKRKNPLVVQGKGIKKRKRSGLILQKKANQWTGTSLCRGKKINRKVGRQYSVKRNERPKILLETEGDKNITDNAEKRKELFGINKERGKLGRKPEKVFPGRKGRTPLAGALGLVRSKEGSGR